MEKIICNAWYYKDGEKYCPFMQDGVCKIHSGNSMIECGMSKEGNSDKDKKENQPLGWICPRCGKVNSPFVPECDCPPPIITKITTDSGSYNSLELKES